MKTIKLRKIDCIIPKLVYRLDKIGLKRRDKRILRFSRKLCDYIGTKYNIPNNTKWFMGKNYIEY